MVARQRFVNCSGHRAVDIYSQQREMLLHQIHHVRSENLADQNTHPLFAIDTIFEDVR